MQLPEEVSDITVAEGLALEYLKLEILYEIGKTLNFHALYLQVFFFL